ncbi:hypothetical protein TMES_05895 [Thalassospira mesophila]|uniref:Uncharacterized protein n=1 Tax=Thalassospira mesophila TaxID=1293891 RepID=A0A1Y2L2Z6_9PROT|nr:hypothetical protein TMES_05895 [Thalassospira mesophila]
MADTRSWAHKADRNTDPITNPNTDPNTDPNGDKHRLIGFLYQQFTTATFHDTFPDKSDKLIVKRTARYTGFINKTVPTGPSGPFYR